MARRVAIYKNPSGSRTDLIGKNAYLMTPTSTNALYLVDLCALKGRRPQDPRNVYEERDSFANCLPTHIRRSNPNDR